MSAWEADINDVTGCDSEQEHATGVRVRLAAEALFDRGSIRIEAPFIIMGHIPSCMQQ